MAKRYYWLKLYDDFFGSLRIKKLRKLAGGDTYTIIYLKMQLKAMKSDGVLEWKGIEDDFASELALDIDEDVENVKVTVAYLLSCGLAETSDNQSFFLPYAVENTGSEDASAQRVRDFRKRKALQCNTDVTPVKRLGNAEKEIEKEKEIDTKDRGKKQRTKKFVPPTLEEVEAYCKERNSPVDPKTFYEYFTADPDRQWIDSKGNPVRNWKSKIITWESREPNKRKEKFGGKRLSEEEVDPEELTRLKNKMKEWWGDDENAV